MNCFQLVQKVLDATYDEVPGTDAERDAAIRSSLRAMSDRYLTKLVTEGGPDFKDPVTRFAYVFCYVPVHAHWLYELMTWSPEAAAVFDNARVRVTCLGGGPGSDLVGVLKFMAKQGKSPTLYCEIVDGCVQWKQTWSDLTYELNLETSVHTNYIIHDVGNEESWNDPCHFGKADLFTLNFFGSEIFRLGEKAERYIAGVFNKAKPGAIFLYNDNNSAQFYEWLDGIAAASSVKTLIAKQGRRSIVSDQAEQRGSLGRFEAKFDYRPRLTGQLAWRVMRKE